MSFIGSKEGFLEDYLQLVRNVLNQLPVKFPANSVEPCNELLYAIVFRNMLASTQRAMIEEATHNPLICYESYLWSQCGPRDSLPHLAVSWEGSLGYSMPSKDSD